MVVCLTLIVALFGIYIFINFNSRGPQTSTSSLNEPAKVVVNFYKYYLSNIYAKKDELAAPTVKLENGIYKLDSSAHLDFLNKSGFFSKDFYSNELPQFNLCDDALKTVSVSEVSKTGGMPTDFVKGDACSFLLYYQWVGGQGEALNTVHVVSSNTTGNVAVVTVAIGQQTDDTDNYIYSYPSVSLVDEAGLWKIASIRVSFKL